MLIFCWRGWRLFLSSRWMIRDGLMIICMEFDGVCYNDADGLGFGYDKSRLDYRINNNCYSVL